jgi:SAM-dependent methyltransferase
MELFDRIKLGWDLSVDCFGKSVNKELQEGQANAWVELILENAPGPAPLKILDVGTGPGYFPIILTRAGQRVVGVDFNEGMVEEAKKIIEAMGLDIDIRQMPAQELDFPDGSFDMVINRNVVWTLLDAERAFSEWLRVLRPGGRLVYFDAEYLKRESDPEFKAKCDRDREEYEAIYGKIDYGYDPKDEDLINGWNKDMPLCLVDRPQWDLEALTKAGFAFVRSEIVYERITSERKRILSRSCPMFMVVGQKASA